MTVCPASTLVVVPESVKLAPFSAALITSSVAIVLMVIAAGVRSTVTGCVMLTGFSALLSPETAILTVPAGQALTCAAVMPTLQLPSACTAVVYSTLLIVTVSGVPSASPELLPVTTSACPCSMILTTSSPATVSTRRPGRLASMVISRVPLPVLPF